jgi:hypothetical protein
VGGARFRRWRKRWRRIARALLRGRIPTVTTVGSLPPPWLVHRADEGAFKASSSSEGHAACPLGDERIDEILCRLRVGSAAMSFRHRRRAPDAGLPLTRAFTTVVE